MGIAFLSFVSALQRFYQNNKSSGQHFRIHNRVAREATIAVAKNGTLDGVRPLGTKIDKLTGQIKALRYGGYALTVASLGLSAYSVYEDWDTEDRWRTLTKEVVGTGTALFLGYAILTGLSGGLFIAIVAAVGVAAASLLMSEGAGVVYDAIKNPYKVKHLLRLERFQI